MRFTGFGASEMATSLFPLSDQPFRKGWEALGERLRAAVSLDELAGLSRGTQYAHYTPEYIVRAFWRAVRRLGFTGGSILEPGCGVGMFFALMPPAAADASVMVGIEADTVTARVAQITEADFTSVKLPAGFDLAIGNPPFSPRSIRGTDELGKLGLNLHEHFIARAIRLLRPGGLAAFVVSRFLMDKADPTARAYIGGMADLLGAIRLPETAMRADAGTDVVVDLLFLRKRDGAEAGAGEAWAEADFLVVEHPEKPAVINRYWRAHPEMVLGGHAITSSQYGPAYTVLTPPLPLEALLDEAIERLPRGVYQPAPGAVLPEEEFTPAPRVEVGSAATGAAIKEGSYFVDSADALLRKHDLYAQADYASGEERKRLLTLAAEAGQSPGALWQIVDGRPELTRVKVGGRGEGIFAKHAAVIRDLLPIRDAARDVLRAQEASQPWEEAQAKLTEAYRAFVKAHGPINLTKHKVTTDPITGKERERSYRPNLAPFADDPDCWLVASVEEYNEDDGSARPGPIFTERVVRAPAQPTITSPEDALAVTLNERGMVVPDRIGELLHLSAEEALAALGDAVFHNPDTQLWETRDEYLSGTVRTKLAQAREAAKEDAAYERNVLALEAVQPEDLPPSEIVVRLGAPWVPTTVVEDFIREVIGVRAEVLHTENIASWTVSGKGWHSQSAETTSEWGTTRRKAQELIEDALNARTPAVYDTLRNPDGNTTRILNVVDTEAAKERLTKIKTAFAEWFWKQDAEKVEDLMRLYNDIYNDLVTRKFDGAHLTLPGANPAVAVSAHQRRVIWRILATGNTYVAHPVGAGKTRSVVAAVMEQKRLGLISKPMIVVPGHTLTQWAREFLMLYPTARILVADETNFAKAKRLRFLGRAATGQWDAIIITHSAFKFIPSPAKFERSLIRAQIREFESALEVTDKEDRISRKRLEQLKEQFEAKFKELRSVKDDMLTIAEVGVDQIIVDEAQGFRKLTFITNQTTLRGIDPDGSQRAWDLYVKARFVQTVNPGREIVQASGTPITNTMGELFTLLRYMAPEALRTRGIHQFDAWAASFCDTRTDLELQPSGSYKPVTRFSEFVNIPELTSIFRTTADVLTKEDLRPFMNLPAVRGGRRQIVTAPASADFKAYQGLLAERIEIIRERHGRPQKGDDILLSVITDGRHAAIDMRLTDPKADIERFSLTDEDVDWSCVHHNDPANKLNALIDNAFRIWSETAHLTYTRPNGDTYATPGASQMIFSDLGTLNAEAKRGFSAYAWIKARLISLGVPAEQIAFMQDYKKAEAKRRLFDAVNGGKVRFLIGSSETMGTGVNAQTRLIAMHHLDVPWLPAWIEQREGRIERQGNQNPEVQIYAYATLGSMDATMWQANERKQRFINAALAGDRSIRRLEDIGDSSVDQFAMAKAIASGDPRLMQKAGLESELNRLYRLRSAHFDDQHAVRFKVSEGTRIIESNTRKIAGLEQDVAQAVDTRGEAFRMVVDGEEFEERKLAGAALLKIIRTHEFDHEPVDRIVGSVGGFPLRLYGESLSVTRYHIEVTVERAAPVAVKIDGQIGALGLVSRIENVISRIDQDLYDAQWFLKEAERQVANYRTRIGLAFEYEDELDAKEEELQALNASLAATPENGKDAELTEIAA